MPSQRKMSVREILAISIEKWAEMDTDEKANAIFDKLGQLGDEVEKLMDTKQLNWEYDFQILKNKILTLYCHSSFDQPLSGCYEGLVEFVENFDC